MPSASGTERLRALRCEQCGATNGRWSPMLGRRICDACFAEAAVARPTVLRDVVETAFREGQARLGVTPAPQGRGYRLRE